MSNFDRFFASDNSATVHPDVMDAIVQANQGHALSYGDDDWTRLATRTLQKHFGRKSSIGFVYNGTGANVVGMQLGLASYQAVICTDVSHINTDECGAAERYIGAKLLPVPAPLGRMDPKDILRHLHALGVEHHSQPRIVSVTQATELGTVYHPDMIREIARLCRANGLYLHMDGARLSNAAVALDEDLAGVSTRLGVDILSLGATKNGLMFGEAVVITRPELAKVLPFVRKQGMQLASKMRFISAQFHGMFSTDLWARNARAANSMAQLLAQELRRNENVEIVYPVEANAVFARLPAKAIGPAQREVFFYTWDEADRVVRLMCSFDTTEEDIRRLVSAIGRAVA